MAFKTKNEYILECCIVVISSFASAVLYFTVDSNNPMAGFYYSLYPRFDSYEERTTYLENIEERVNSLLKLGKKNKLLIDKCNKKTALSGN